MHHRHPYRAYLVAVALVGSAFATSPAANAAVSAASSQQRVHVGAEPLLPRGAQSVAALPASAELQLTVALKSQNASGLASFASEVATPTSPLFRHYLSVAQFAREFGATPEQVTAVQSALRAHGLSVGTPMANDLTLPARGTAAQIERAFSISLSRVKLPTGRTAYANDQAPSISANAAQFVQGVIGLDNVALDAPQQVTSSRRRSRSPEALTSSPFGAGGAGVAGQIVTGGPQPCAQAKETEQFNGGYTADRIASAYQFSDLYLGGDLGAGQTIALFEQQPYSTMDIATYQACYGTSAPVSNVEVDGGPGPFEGQDGESALDIEQLTGLAPRASVLVYQGPFTTNAPVDIISAIVSQDVAKVVSSSYGVCEAFTPNAVMSAENTLLQEAAVQGQSFFISSGDSGSEQCSQVEGGNRSLSVLNPAGQPFATSVGGTNLYSVKGGVREFYDGELPPSEGVWNEGFRNEGGASGGGVSKEFAMPSYQSGASGSLGVVNSSSSSTPCGQAPFCRQVPDVSADADRETGYVVFSENKWGVAGGTSAAAPVWAAFTGLANASAACRAIPIGFVNPALYAIAGSSYLSNFHDVTEASLKGRANNNPEGFGRFPVGSGYDMATGIGTPIAPNLAASLCALVSPVFTVGVGNPGSQTSVATRPVSLQITGSDSGGSALSYSASGLPAGLGISPSGLVSGTPTTLGTSIVTVATADARANRGSTQFTWSIVAPPTPPPSPLVGVPTVSHASLSGIARRNPRLRFTVAEGIGAPAINAITIALPRGLVFSTSTKSLLKGIVVTGAGGKRVKFKVKLKRGVLVITLSKPLAKAQLTLTAPAISVSGILANRIKHHKVKTLSVIVTATDAAQHSTRLVLKAKPR